MKQKITWNLLSKYRGELFGFSIISIIIFHYFEDLNAVGVSGAAKLLTKAYIWLIGSIGVEIFIFLSGFGLYYSLRKQFNIPRYIYNRIERTIIPYILYGGIFWILIDLVISGGGIKKFLLDYSLISFWKDGNKHLWFVAFIIAMYIVFPYIYKLFVKQKNKAKKRNTILLMCIVYLLGLGVILKMFPDFFENTEIALTRVPVFILGIYYGEKSYERETFSKMDKVLIVSGLLLRCVSIFDGTGNTPIYWRIRMGIYSMLVMWGVVIFLEILSCNSLNRILRSVGKYSYELYLTSVTARIIMKELGYKTSQLLVYVLCVVIALIMSYLLVKVERWFNKNIYERNKEKTTVR